MSAAALMDFDSETMSPRDDFRRIGRVNRAPRVETYEYILTPRNLAASSPPSMLPLFSIVAEGRSLPLAHPLTLRVSIEEGIYFVENDTLRLFGKGTSLVEAIQAFQRDLVYYWRYYCSLSDGDVAGAGVELKKTYDTLVTV